MSTTSDAVCQSCAMPLVADPMGGGSELDGAKSSEYCSYCYRNGAFTDPSLTMEGMIARLKPLMASMNVPADAAAEAISALPHLNRWRGKSGDGR